MNYRNLLKYNEFILSDVDAENVFVCAFLPDGTRFNMKNSFSSNNLEDFTLSLINNSISQFLSSGYSTNPPDVGAVEINSYDLVQRMESSSDMVILFVKSSTVLFDDNLSRSFAAAAEALNKEIEFVWMNMNKNEIAPKLLDRFTVEMTSIYIRSDRSTVKFSPVSTENADNLQNLLIKFIKQRKLYH